MITASSLTNGTLTIVIDNGVKILTAKSDHPKWTDIISAFKAKNNQLLESLISLKNVVEQYSVGALSINTTGVTYNGKPLHTTDSSRVMAFLRENLPYEPIANYIEKKLKNPSKRAIDEMYNFLEHKHMPLTPSGNFIAYKGVQKDYFSVTGNSSTVVLQGEVNNEGKIKNEIGATIEVERSSVDDNYKNGCSEGLHAGSLKYATDFGSHGRVILVEINPADVVSIPDDCECQKLRCCKYKVIGEYTGKLRDTYTSEYESPVNDKKSKFTNQSHTTLKRDAHGRFIKNNTPATQHSVETVKSEAEIGYNEFFSKTKLGIDKSTKEQPDSSAFNFEENLFIKSIFERIVTSYNLVMGLDGKMYDCNTLMNFNVDSLDLVEIFMALEEEFKIDIDDSTFDDSDLNKFTFATATNCIIREIFKQRIHGLFKTDFFMHGFVSGTNDKEESNSPKFVGCDEKGTDSENHTQYVYGYIVGYSASNFLTLDEK